MTTKAKIPQYRVERLSFTIRRELEDTFEMHFGESSSYTDLDPEGLAVQLNKIAAEGWRLIAVERIQVNAAAGERLCIFEKVK